MKLYTCNLSLIMLNYSCEKITHPYYICLLLLKFLSGKQSEKDVGRKKQGGKNGCNFNEAIIRGWGTFRS